MGLHQGTFHIQNISFSVDYNKAELLVILTIFLKQFSEK